MLNYQNNLDRAFQALADPTRRAVVERLCLGPASVSELAQPLAMSLPAVVQHLQVLEASGLIRTEPQTMQAVEGWIAQRRRSWEQHFDRLGEYLAEQERHDAPASNPKSSKPRNKR